MNYENLPAEYREASAKVWERYDLFPKGGWKARFAKGNTELAMVFTLASADTYLKQTGALGFVITQSVFQSKASGRGFREFRVGTKRKLEVTAVHDFTSMKPFEGAVNRTATFSGRVSETGTMYPVEYISWSPKRGSQIDSGDSLASVNRQTDRQRLSAWPVEDSASPWMLLPKSVSKSTVEKLTKGKQIYRAWKGADTRGGNGLFWLDILSADKGLIVARNTPEFSKKKPPQVTWTFEPDLIYPLLKGRDVQRWGAQPKLALLYPHEGDRAIPEDELKRRFPKTFGYLRQMEPDLRKRKMFDLSFRELAFYSLFETGEFLLSPYKVVWRYIASELTCSVVEPRKVALLDNRTVIPDHKLVVLPCDNALEAHYVCAMLNSAPARFVAGTYIVGTQISTHVLEYVKVPAFEADLKSHSRLADLSQQCHTALAKNDSTKMITLETEIDETAAKLWHISEAELNAFQESLRERRFREADSTEADE